LIQELIEQKVDKESFHGLDHRVKAIERRFLKPTPGSKSKEPKAIDLGSKQAELKEEVEESSDEEEVRAGKAPRKPNYFRRGMKKVHLRIDAIENRCGDLERRTDYIAYEQTRVNIIGDGERRPNWNRLPIPKNQGQQNGKASKKNKPVHQNPSGKASKNNATERAPSKTGNHNSSPQRQGKFKSGGETKNDKRVTNQEQVIQANKDQSAIPKSDIEEPEEEKKSAKGKNKPK
jgi:hypothetical protein